MSEDGEKQNPTGEDGRVPIFTLPSVIVSFAGVLLAIHVARMFVLDARASDLFTLYFAFIPLRLSAESGVPGGSLPLLWTPVTHALMHADWEHLLINTAWLAIFGTPVARRYGALSFLIIFFVSALFGAAFFAVTAGPGFHILVGASGGISGLTGVAIRFMFQPVQVARDPVSEEVVVLGRRLAGLGDLVRDVRPRTFIIVWVLFNGLAPLLPLLIGGAALPIAWQAHLGGFFAGLLMAPLFERKTAVDGDST